MTSVFKKGPVYLGILVLLGGCYQPSTAKNWQHKSIPPAQWAKDYHKCQRAADRYLIKDGRYNYEESASQYDQQMQAFKVGKKQSNLISNCMKRLGYVVRR